MSDFLAAEARKEAERAAAWQKAVDKLSITFEADQKNGGCPAILVSARSEEERIKVLRGLGFRVLERWEMDYSSPGCAPDMRLWIRISGNISVSLSDGFVCRPSGVRKR